MLTALAFTEADVRALLKRGIDLIPADSEYHSVVSFAWECCERYEDWHQALADCQEKYKKYNWIHAYPNACCEVIALYYGNGDYEKTLRIVTMCGVDVDCNAGMIMPILAIREGMRIIPEKLDHPAFRELVTYMRGMSRLTLDELVGDTLNSILHATNKEEV